MCELCITRAFKKRTNHENKSLFTDIETNNLTKFV